MYGSSEMGNVCVGGDAVTNQYSVSSISDCTVASPHFCLCASRADRGENRNRSQKSPKFAFLLPCSDRHRLHTSGKTAKKWTAAEEVSGPPAFSVLGTARTSRTDMLLLSKPNQCSMNGLSRPSVRKQTSEGRLIFSC